jgi:methylthioribose-1-phosphate isomerase
MSDASTDFRPIEWTEDNRVRFLDQTLLPGSETWIETDDYRVIEEAIRSLRVRGAPLIGIAAAYGLALAARSTDDTDCTSFVAGLRAAADELRSTRPTAVNLAWALDRTLSAVEQASSIDDIRRTITSEALTIHEEDIAANHAMAEHGASLLVSGGTAMTHCNAGALATGGYGTALGVLRLGWERGTLKEVYATETRPLLQGARLTAWELRRAGVPVSLVTDSSAGSVIKRGLVDEVVVGADRIAANGDVANKIGTYQMAVIARENDVPFYVAAPTSTIDLNTASGDDIPIEDRSPDEVTAVHGATIAPEGVGALNPAFDVTPNRYVTAIITERGIALPPYQDSLANLFRSEVPARG